MISALLMAVVAIVYIIQAFRIPTGSMEESLKVGDFLLGLKFIYGSPILPIPGTYAKFPGITNPKPGDVVIFKYPGTDRKDYIKRCIAGPGQTVEIEGKTLLVDGKKLLLPPRGQFTRDGMLNQSISNFSPLRIPARGDTIVVESMPEREFLFLKHLIHQEHPRKSVTVKYQLYLDGEYSNHVSFPLCNQAASFNDLHVDKVRCISPNTGRFDYLNFNRIDNWLELDAILSHVKAYFSDRDVKIQKGIFLDDQPIHKYVIKYDNYFMMGDNRDNSMDSRYWGYLNRNFIKAKAFILYFSLEKNVPIFLLPMKIRWNRIGKLIRSYHKIAPDGLQPGIDETDEPDKIPDSLNSEPEMSSQSPGTIKTMKIKEDETEKDTVI